MSLDFSEFGIPSAHWLTFIATNPAAEQDGFEYNHLQTKPNEAREDLISSHISRLSITPKASTTTLQIPTRTGTIPLRRTIPAGYTGRPLRALLYFHDGGLLSGTETSDEHLCGEIAAALNIAVLGVVYRRTPEFTFPAQLEDAEDAYEWIVQHASELHVDVEGMAILGSSAGAFPATTVLHHDLMTAQRTGRRSLFSGIVLTVPWLIHRESYPDHVFAPGQSSREQCADAPGLPWERVQRFKALLGGGEIELGLNPGLWADKALGMWPRTGIVVAGMDPLRDDGLLLAMRLEKLRVRTSVNIFPGVPHNIRKWTEIPTAAAFDDKTIECVSWALGLCSQRMAGWHEWQEASIEHQASSTS